MTEEKGKDLWNIFVEILALKKKQLTATSIALETAVNSLEIHKKQYKELKVSLHTKRRNLITKFITEELETPTKGHTQLATRQC